MERNRAMAMSAKGPTGAGVGAGGLVGAAEAPEVFDDEEAMMAAAERMAAGQLPEQPADEAAEWESEMGGFEEDEVRPCLLWLHSLGLHSLGLHSLGLHSLGLHSLYGG